MNSSRLKNEGWLYWLAFLIALGFRFIQLGASPLGDSEAALALQALDIARGQSPLLDPQPAYILFTSILFAITESTNFMARAVPALIGSLLVFIPYLFREKLNPRPALILAFLMAFSPGLVALSRQANGTMLAVTFLLFAWGMWINGRTIPAGVFAGLALLSGTSLWAGLLTLGLTWIFRRGTEARSTDGEYESSNYQSPAYNIQFSNVELRPPLIALIVTLIFGGTLFFIAPNGISAALSSLPAYLSGWTSPSVMTPGRMLLTILAYEPLGIILATLSVIRGFRTKSKRILRLSLWLAVSVLLAIFYRQATELIWVIIPLLTLAALELARSIEVQPDERVEVGVVVTAIMILLIYIWFNVSNIAVNPYAQIPAVMPIFGEVQNPRYVIMYGASAILLVCIAMVGFGWSPRIARLGTVWAFTIFLSFYSLATAWGASGLRNLGGVELWSTPKPLHADLLLASVDDISEFSLGHIDSQPVTIMGIDSPALEWVLKDHQVEVVSALDPQVAPPLVVTQPMDNLNLPSAYRGQDFTWRQTPRWEQIQNPDWWSWLVYRQLPKDDETIILWARDDLFPDAREDALQP